MNCEGDKSKLVIIVSGKFSASLQFLDCPSCENRRMEALENNVKNNI